MKMKRADSSVPTGPGDGLDVEKEESALKPQSFYPIMPLLFSPFHSHCHLTWTIALASELISWSPGKPFSTPQQCQSDLSKAQLRASHTLALKPSVAPQAQDN